MDKRYIIEDIHEKGRRNYRHDIILNCLCYLAYVKVGERAWILYQETHEYHPHVCHLSTVQEVRRSPGILTIETKNSIYTLREVESK